MFDLILDRALYQSQLVLSRTDVLQDMRGEKHILDLIKTGSLIWEYCTDYKGWTDIIPEVNALTKSLLGSYDGSKVFTAGISQKTNFSKKTAPMIIEIGKMNKLVTL